MLPAAGGLVVLLILFSVANPQFLSARNMANLMTQAAALVVLGMALVFVLLLGEIDLSVGVTFGVAMSVFVRLTQPGGMNWILALLVALAIGATVGALIGFFVAKIGVPSFVVTLGLFLGLQGVILLIIGAGGLYRVTPEPVKAIQNSNLPVWAGWALLVALLAGMFAMALWDRARRVKSGALNGPLTIPIAKIVAVGVIGAVAVFYFSVDRGTATFSLRGVPIVVPLVLILLVAGTFVLDRTTFGRYIYAIGGNAEAARRAGVKVAAIKWTAFIVASTLAVIAGLFTVSKTGSVDASIGVSIVLSGVAAAVVGGVSLFGGRGRLVYAVIGALVIAAIENGLLLLQMSAGVYYAVTGAVLILAATVDAIARRRGGSLTPSN
jgi:D-xylose transport system permease protein